MVEFLSKPSPGAGISGGFVWKLSFNWDEGGRLLGGAWSCPGVVEEELGPVPGSSPAPLPGVMAAPLAPAKGGRACGVGASGTAGCCSWAIAAGFPIRLTFRIAVSDHAVKPSFTVLLPGTVGSFQRRVKRNPRSLMHALLPVVRVPWRAKTNNGLPKTGKLTANRIAGLQSSDYQTGQSRHV